MPITRCHFSHLLMGILFLAALLPSMVLAQGLSSGGGGSGDRIEGSFKFLPIPYVNYDRSLGFQLGGLPMAMFNPVENDTLSPSSMAGLFGMYTTNETWMLMGFSKLHLDEDNWRIMAAGGTGNYNFQFFIDAPISSWIPYSTDMNLGFIQLQRRLYKHLYGGVNYVYLDFITNLEGFPQPKETTLNGIGLNLSLDHRSSVFYPRWGYETKIHYFSFPSSFGNESQSDKIQLEYHRYFSMRQEEDVLACRFFAGLGLGDLSFEQQFIVGSRQDIRGYTQGEYRGDYLLALQGEYRWNLHSRIGLVGFAGVATVFKSINEDDDGKLLPGGGAGFRYTVDKETNMNVGLDVAVGKDDWGIYFKLGEAF